jgi:hypothetical protein
MLGSYIYSNIKTLIKLLNKNISFLEIGSWDGEGIADLCDTFPNSEFYSIDPFIEDGNTMHISMMLAGEKLEHIKEQFKKNTCKLDNLRHYELTTQAFLNKYSDILPEIDILLIDGDHSFLGASTDLLLASILAYKKDLIVFMDDFNKESVRKAYDIFARLHQINFEITDCVDFIKFKLKIRNS